MSPPGWAAAGVAARAMTSKAAKLVRRDMGSTRGKARRQADFWSPARLRERRPPRKRRTEATMCHPAQALWKGRPETAALADSRYSFPRTFTRAASTWRRRPSRLRLADQIGQCRRDRLGSHRPDMGGVQHHRRHALLLQIPRPLAVGPHQAVADVSRACRPRRRTRRPGGMRLSARSRIAACRDSFVSDNRNGSWLCRTAGRELAPAGAAVGRRRPESPSSRRSPDRPRRNSGRSAPRPSSRPTRPPRSRPARRRATCPAAPARGDLLDRPVLGVTEREHVGVLGQRLHHRAGRFFPAAQLGVPGARRR